MKRKQVMAMLLAVSLAAANVVTAPVDAYAAIYVAGSVGAVGAEEATKTTVTLEGAVETGATIYISAADVEGEKTVTVKPDGTTYTRILKCDGVPAGVEDFTEESVSVEITAADFTGETTAVELYLLKADAENIDDDGNMICVAVSKDQAAPSIGSFQVGGTDALYSEATSESDEIVLNTENPQLTLTITDVDSGVKTVGYWVDSNETPKATTAEDMTDASFTTYSPEEETQGVTIALTEGTNYVYAKLADNVGNTTYVRSKKIVVDTIAPTLATLTAADEDAKSTDLTVGSENPALAITASEDTGVTISYATGAEPKTAEELAADDTITYDSYMAGQTLTLANTEFTYVYVKLEDGAGNVAYACSGKITVDTTAPTCTLTAAPADAENGAEAMPNQTNAYDITSGNVKVTFEAGEGDEITKVTVDDLEDSEAKTSGYATLSTAGKHTITVDLKHTANGKTDTKSMEVTCYKTVSATATTPVTKEYGSGMAVTDFYSNLDESYAGEPVNRYLASTADAAPESEMMQNSIEGLPTDAGTYWVMTYYPADGYYLENRTYSKLTISKKTGETVTWNGTATVCGSDITSSGTVELADLFEGYAPEGEKLTYTVGSATGEGASSVSGSNTDGGASITIKGSGTAVDADKDAVLPVTVTGFKNYESIVVNIPVRVTKKLVAGLAILADSQKVYDGTAAPISYQLDGHDISAEDLANVTIKKDGSETVSDIKDAGTYTITAEFENEEATGYATWTIVVSKRPVTLQFMDTEVIAGTDAGEISYPQAPVNNNLANGHTVVIDGAITLSSAYTAEAAADDEFAYTGCPENSIFQIKDGENDVTDNYEITVVNGKVIVKAAAGAGSGNGAGNGTGGISGDWSGSTGGNTTQTGDKTQTGNKTETETQTTGGKLETNADGDTVIVDQTGKAVVEDVVKIDGAKYITDEKGVVIKNDFATTPSGNKVYTQADGKIVTNKTFTVDGKKYVAKKSGAIVTKAFVTTAKGNKIYCSKSGAIITNKAFKVNGKTYVAKKSGALVKNAWVKIGGKKYYCNKNGVVIKTKK